LYTDFLAHQDKLDILKAAQLLAEKLHVFHGDQDLSVPLTEAYELGVVSGAAVMEIAGADHVFGATHPWNKQQMPVHLDALCSKTLNCL
jgi:hypothetical protein